MALSYTLQLVFSVCLILLLASVESTPARRGKKQNGGGGGGVVTCPGFPGYCSESYVGNTCLVVCARGRNNVPQCQEDGTWTDVPRCIEHEPGQEQQVTDYCPGVPGYCSLDLPGGLCTFQCPIGPAVRSSCTEDGTWEPYPTCEGDPRETQDGCNPCPGPNGGPRNRTANAGGGGGNNRNGGGGGGFNNRNNGAAKKNNGGNRNGGNNRANTRNNNNGGGNNRRNSGGGAGNNRNNNNGGHKPAANNNRNNVNTRNNNNNKKKNNRGPAQQPRSNGGFSPRNSGGGGGGKKNAVKSSCPGDVLQACIDVCPGFHARVFAACVNGCAKRCPGKK